MDFCSTINMERVNYQRRKKCEVQDPCDSIIAGVDADHPAYFILYFRKTIILSKSLNFKKRFI